MLREKLINALQWLRADMLNACALVYSCLDNTSDVIDAVCQQIADPVDRFAAIIYA